MKAKTFIYFIEAVQQATVTSPVWGFGEYWSGMTEKQRSEIAQILEHKPDVMKLDRNGVRVYQFPNGREWQED